LIISNWILFLISSLVIWFDFFSNLGLILLIAIYFILESFSWLICFYSNSTLGFILIHLIYMSNLFLILLISIFFCFALFFSLNICLIKNFFFLGLFLIGSFRSYDSSNRSCLLDAHSLLSWYFSFYF
jgi:hypothetical protein